jgi:hypothetical protein
MPDSNSNAVSIMEAAFLAQVHVSNIYRIRAKLRAFQENGNWLIPRDALNKYIANRIKRARDVLATAAAIEDKTVES